ncbi:MAG: hypothetical protein ATN35_10760 [Epulopiscium sp. Nele67-Bin004]|nr:MAG: hypothetical protein ATN35_10760 [Epulopiscium sp. Nele67-Bin004]
MKMSKKLIAITGVGAISLSLIGYSQQNVQTLDNEVSISHATQGVVDTEVLEQLYIQAQQVVVETEEIITEEIITEEIVTQVVEVTETVEVDETAGTLYTSKSKVVATGQTDSYDKDGNIITVDASSTYYGQDAQYYDSMPFSYTDNGDGTITDNSTGLMWQQIPVDYKMTWSEAVEFCENLELGGYDDWRLPTADELFSLSDFSEGWPFIDTSIFAMPDESSYMQSAPQGGMSGGPQSGGAPQTSGGPQTGTSELPPITEEGENVPPAGENTPPPMTTGESAPPPMTTGENTPPPAVGGESDDAISKDEGQFWSSNYYLVEEEGARQGVAFGVNHATGHIKAYQAEAPSNMGKNVRAVRGDEYAANDYIDNGDGTITDTSTGLMWMSADMGIAVDWETALVTAQSTEFAGYDDWRLPDVKELQTLLDYSGSYPAIDPEYFTYTTLEDNEFFYYWTSTSAYFSTADPTNYYAWYVAFGYAIDDNGEDYHGAGGVRFSQKYLESEAMGEGGDNILNSVRLVRTAE